MNIHLHSKDYSTNIPNRFYTQMTIVGMGLILATMVYLVASNWFYWSHMTRMALTIGLMALLDVISAFVKSDTPRQVLQTASVTMIGLSLAVIGQAYQTGADSFWLFVIWSLLALPWLYRQNVGVFFIVIIVSQLALYLYFTQNYFDAFDIGYLLAFNLLSLMQLVITLKFYPSARFLMVGIISILSLLSALGAADLHRQVNLNAVISLISIVALPLFTVWQFKKHQEQACLALTLSGMGASLLAWFIFMFFDNIHSYFVFGALTFMWFALLGILVARLFPGGRFHALPVGIGAYLTGLLFSSAFLAFWGDVSFWMGLVCFVLSLIAIHTTSKHPTSSSKTLFIRHLCYALMLCGQLSFLLRFSDDSILITLIAQAIFTSLVMLTRVHWFVIVGQWLGLYGLACGYFVYEINAPLWFLHAISLTAMALFIIAAHCKRSAIPIKATCLYLPIIMMATFIQEFWLIIDTSTSKAYRPVEVLILQGAWLLALLWGYRRQIPNLALSVALAIILVGLGQFEMAILVAGLAWSIKQDDKFINGLYLFGMVALLWYSYYSLSMTFLQKSSVMLTSGVAIIAITALAKHINRLPKELS